MPTTLTAHFVAKISVHERAEFFDKLAKGLSLRVTPAGAKSWALTFTRPADGKRGRLTLGAYPALSLADARKLAVRRMHEVAEGVDPIAEKAAEAAAMRVRDLVESYLSRHVASKRSAAEIGRRLRKNVVDVIGDVKLSALHKRDVTRVIDAVVDRGAGIEANRVTQDLRACLRWAAARGDVDAGLAIGIRLPTPTQPRERVLSASEIVTMWNALPAAGMTETMRQALRFALVTGQRIGEVVGMHVDEIDIDARTWTLAPSRVKNKKQHTVYLSTMALEIIREQLDLLKESEKRRAAREKVDARPVRFIFPGPAGAAPLTNMAVSKALKRLEKPVSKGALETQVLGVSTFTPHDLRRSCATGMAELGVTPFILGHILNHVSTTQATITTKVYARHSYAKEKAEALELWSMWLSNILSGAADNVVPLRPSA